MTALRGQYLATSQFLAPSGGDILGSAGVFGAEAIDPDGVRDTGDGEAIQTFTLSGTEGVVRFGGQVNPVNEVVVTLYFEDGTTLPNVLAVEEFVGRVFGRGQDNLNYLIDQNALASVGKSMGDVGAVLRTAVTDHDLTYADLGFEAGAPIFTPGSNENDPTDIITLPGRSGSPSQAPIVPVEDLPDVDEPGPQPDPQVTLVIGTDGRDRLNGTDGDDVIVGGDGNDRLRGKEGADTFVFGADASDGNRDRDVILDFDMDEDLIVLEDGALVRNIVERNGNAVIRLEDDRDVIVVRNADADIIDNIVFEDDSFLV